MAHLETSRPHYTPMLVILLIVASYFLGTLTTKIQYMEGNKTGTVAQQNPSNQGIAGISNPQGGTVGGQVAGQQVIEPPKPPEAGHLPPLGEKQAKVTLIEFSDFQCPFCKRMFDETYPQLKADYIDTGKVKLVFRHYPLSFHPYAQKTAEATECANEQQKFWEYHDVLFKNQDTWSAQTATQIDATLTTYATELGLDAGKFSLCLQNGTYKKEVEEDFAAGNKAGVSGTPTTFINGKSIVGAQPYSAFKAEIDAALKEAK